MLQNFSTATFLFSFPFPFSFRLLYQIPTRSCSLIPNVIEALALTNEQHSLSEEEDKEDNSVLLPPPPPPPKPVTKHPKPQQLYSPSAWKTDCR
jgi:hypothetical protein